MYRYMELYFKYFNLALHSVVFSNVRALKNA